MTNHQHTKSQQSKTMETRLHKKIENLEQIFLKFACIVGGDKLDRVLLDNILH